MDLVKKLWILFDLKLFKYKDFKKISIEKAGLAIEHFKASYNLLVFITGDSSNLEYSYWNPAQNGTCQEIMQSLWFDL